MIEIKKGFTHNGTFHADDVLSTAFLEILFPEIKIERGKEVPENYDGIVYDIGGGEYDHHMASSPVRENGIPYAAFGLLWKKFGPTMFNMDMVERFDKEFVQYIDETDNTGKPNMLSQTIKDFNPAYGERASSNKKFWEAVKFAKPILERKLELLKIDEKIKNTIRPLALACDKQYLVIENGIPMKDFALEGTGIDYVISASERGGYNIRVVGKKEANYFPEEWRGLSEEELFSSSEIQGFRFCHRTGFVAATESLDSAIEVVEKTIERNR